MALGLDMRIKSLIISLGLCIGLSACATLDTNIPVDEQRIGLSPRNLSAGECGLFVWKADQSKTFILFADQDKASLYRDGAEVDLSIASGSLAPNERKFVDQNGQIFSLSLLDAQEIENSTRYKAGRLISTTQQGWEHVTPVVGLFTCQP